MLPKVLAWPNAGVEVGVREEAFAAPLMLKPLNEFVGVGPGLGGWIFIVGDAAVVIPPAAAPLTLNSVEDDAAALMVRRIVGLSSRIDPFKPS